MKRGAGTAAVVAGFTSAFIAAFLPCTARAADINAVNHAAQIASGVGAGSAVPALGVGAILQTVIGLAVVIALVFGCAWLARRLGLNAGQRGGIVKTIGGTSLGGKERVAVVEIGDRWLVLGAAPGNVRLLCDMPAGTTHAGPGSSGDPSTDDPARPGSGLTGTFGERFRDTLKSEAAKRFQRHTGGDR
ncbi:flagellar biosynthetic protein FliO [Paraburkholderia rhizosphaerae]|nr:flagellar biosynthetic protein FliO [Paraburkholderia rhizosphaerae]